MPGTYTQLLFHVVFATKRRRPWIRSDVASRLYSYIGGIIRAEKGSLLEIGGIADHVHLLVRWRTDAPLSDLLRTMKSRSSTWVHSEFADLSDFAWQEGYGAFSVSKSSEQALRSYILRQEEHHRREDFATEIIRLLRAHGIEFDERFVVE